MDTDLDIDSPFAREILFFFFNELLQSLAPDAPVQRLLDEFHSFFNVKVNFDLEVVSACTCDELSYGSGGGFFSAVLTPFLNLF